jgi:hypothetical protein
MTRFIYGLAMILVLMVAAGAQSTDIDSPTALTSTVIEGEGDGKGETVYYSFTALKGDVKITVDAKTDGYSTPVQIALLDEDGKELLPIYVVALGESRREVKTRRFVRDTKVILKITTRNDNEVKLLTYRIKLDGTVQVETPAATSSTEEQSSTETKTDDKKTKLKDKIKNMMKKKAKETTKEIIDN